MLGAMNAMNALTHLTEGWPAITDEHLEVAGRRVRVLRVAGRHGAGAGEPQLLVHGLGGSSVTWVEVMTGLAAKGPVVAVDLPGFGGTPLGEDTVTMRGYVAFLLDVADTLGWPRFTVHGNSMGGLVATLLAARHPERVERLVLVSPALPPSSPLRLLVPTRATLEGMVPVAVSALSATVLGIVRAGGVPDERRSRQLLGLIFGDLDDVRPELLELMAEEYGDVEDDAAAEHRRATLQAVRSIAALWADPRRAWRAVDRVAAPTLVLGGTADALVPARVLRQVLRRRTDWVEHVLDDRRHALMLESPAEYLDLVDAWQYGMSAVG